MPVADCRRMARRLRLEFDSGLYHVLDRGNYRGPIFRFDKTKTAFLACDDRPRACRACRTWPSPRDRATVCAGSHLDGDSRSNLAQNQAATARNNHERKVRILEIGCGRQHEGPHHGHEPLVRAASADGQPSRGDSQGERVDPLFGRIAQLKPQAPNPGPLATA